jgi:hypothetical protein
LHFLATEQAQLKLFREARFGDLQPLTSSLEKELHTYSTFQQCVNATSELWDGTWLVSALAVFMQFKEQP